MKMYADPAAVEAYLDATDDEQRRFLASEVGPLRLDPSNWGHWVDPSWIDRLEWFASPREVCRVLAALHELSGEPGLKPLRGILAGNRGGLFAPKALAVGRVQGRLRGRRLELDLDHRARGRPNASSSPPASTTPPPTSTWPRRRGRWPRCRPCSPARRNTRWVRMGSGGATTTALSPSFEAPVTLEAPRCLSS